MEAHDVVKAAQFPAETTAEGAFVRQRYRFRDHITADITIDFETQFSAFHRRDLFQRQGFGDTVDFDHITRHYYMTHDQINPSRIVPVGPLVDWTAPHHRDRLS